jgi:hypothetical protein
MSSISNDKPLSLEMQKLINMMTGAAHNLYSEFPIKALKSRINEGKFKQELFEKIRVLENNQNV